MPKYSNPKVPEGVSSGHEHPLADAAKSLAVVFAILLLILFGSYAIARLAIPFVPFSWEQTLVHDELHTGKNLSAEGMERQRYLQSLADRIALNSGFPEEIGITVHYVESDTVNAFATLGGHIFVHKGIWNILDTENAMSMLLAHEMAHIKNRDPIRTAGSSALAGAVVGILVGNDGFLTKIIGGANLLTAMNFSRQQETQADDEAASAVARLYGHINGAGSLFHSLSTATKGKPGLPEILASHPDIEARVNRLQLLGNKYGWKLNGETIPLP